MKKHAIVLGIITFVIMSCAKPSDTQYQAVWEHNGLRYHPALSWTWWNPDSVKTVSVPIPAFPNGFDVPIQSGFIPSLNIPTPPYVVSGNYYELNIKGQNADSVVRKFSVNNPDIYFSE